MKNLIGISNPLILAIVSTLIFLNAGMAMAAVWTDQADYSPGSNVTIHGDNSDNAGYRSGEIVNVSVNGPYQYDSKCSGTADSNGAWSCQVTLSSDYTAVGNYTYTAVGQTSGVTQSGTFTDGRPLHFTESGLPTGTSWSVTVTGLSPSTKEDTVATIAFNVPTAGNYPFIVSSPISDATGIRYVASPVSGTASVPCVGGTGCTGAIPVGIAYTTQYQVNFAASPSGDGTISPSTSDYYNSGSTIPISATANTNYKFQKWSSDTTISIADPSSPSTTATINGPGTITANFVLADSTPPKTTLTISPDIPNGDNGWYKTNVHLTVSASDNTGGSGLAETRCVLDPVNAPSSFNDISTGCAYTTGADVTTDGQHTIYYASKDNAGNIETVQSATFKMDTTSPTITASISPVNPDTTGWYNIKTGAPTVSFTCSDSGSGLSGACPSPVTLSDGANQVITRTISDLAGNSASVSTDKINVDTTPPTLTFGTASPAPNAAGWNNADVSIPFTTSDGLSGVASTSPISPLVLTDEGTEITGTVAVTDNAGNSATFASPTFKIDKTAPTIVTNPSADSCSLPGNAGWCRGTQQAGFSATDSLSGLADTTKASFTQSTTDNGVAVNIASGQVCDVAGNCNSGINAGPYKIDSVAPTITGSRTPAANINGWNNVDVTVHFDCQDTTSGLAGCTADTTLTGEGANQYVTGTATDQAGNTASATVDKINIDKTPPTLTFGTASPAPNAAGWNNADVSIPFTTSDGLSGVASTSPISPLVLTDEGTEITGTVAVTDNAGNSATFTSPAFKIDKTKPTLSILAPVNGQNYILNQAVPSSYSCVDSLSGIASCIGPVSTGSNFDTTTVGSKTFTVNAADIAGNSNSTSNNYNVQYQSSGTCNGDAGHQILQPINNDGSSVFKLGSTVPAKFRVCDANGASIGTPEVVTSFKLTGTSANPSAAIDESVYSTTPDTAFRWDSTAQQWIFNMATKSTTTKYTSGTTYKYTITLNDGSTIPFQFTLR